MSKDNAYRFFKDLEAYLNRKIPPPRVLQGEIDTLVKRAKESKKERHKAFPEGAFLNHYVACNERSAVGSDQTKYLKLARNLEKYALKKALEGHFWP